MQQLFFSRTVHTEFDFAAFFTFQAFHGFFIGDDFSHKGRIVYFHNAVACHQSHLFGWASLNDVVHMDGVILDGKLDTDAAETAF